MFYLLTQSAHFICGFMASDIQFKTAKITRGQTAIATSWATFSDHLLAIFYMRHPTDMKVHTTTFGTPVVEHKLEHSLGCNSLKQINY